MEVETQVSNLCTTIRTVDSESWEIRNKAVIQLTEIVSSYRNKGADEITAAFSASTFRFMKEPIKDMILDLRSQQVRDASQLLMTLADVTGDRMKALLRDTFATILEGVKVPNKVMSTYIDDCIVHLIKHVTFKCAIILIVHEIKESKAKLLRERCLDYINLILMHWDLTDKELDFFVDAIRIGLEDATARAREISRAAYMNMYNLYPDKAEKIKSSLPKAGQLKLTRSEVEGSVEVSSPTGSPDRGGGGGVGASSKSKLPVFDSSGLNQQAKIMAASSERDDGGMMDGDCASQVSESSTNNDRNNSKRAGTSSVARNGSGGGSGDLPTVTNDTHVPNSSSSSSSSSSNQLRARSSSSNSSNTNNTHGSKPQSQQPSIQPTSKKVRGGVGLVATADTGTASTAAATTRSSNKQSARPSRKNPTGMRNEFVGDAEKEKEGGGLSTGIHKQPQEEEEEEVEEEDHNAEDSVVNAAAQSIQAKVRGVQTRRQSVVSNPFASLAVASPPPPPTTITTTTAPTINNEDTVASTATTTTMTETVVADDTLPQPQSASAVTSHPKDGTSSGSRCAIESANASVSSATTTYTTGPSTGSNSSSDGSSLVSAASSLESSSPGSTSSFSSSSGNKDISSKYASHPPQRAAAPTRSFTSVPSSSSTASSLSHSNHPDRPNTPPNMTRNSGSRLSRSSTSDTSPTAVAGIPSRQRLSGGGGGSSGHIGRPEFSTSTTTVYPPAVAAAATSATSAPSHKIGGGGGGGGSSRGDTSGISNAGAVATATATIPVPSSPPPPPSATPALGGGNVGAPGRKDAPSYLSSTASANNRSLSNMRTSRSSNSLEQNSATPSASHTPQQSGVPRSRSANKLRSSVGSNFSTGSSSSPDRSSASAILRSLNDEAVVTPGPSTLFPRHLSLSMKVTVLSGKDPNPILRLPGIVRFIGHTSFAPGIWIGVDLFAPLGKNDGSINGRSYFQTEPQHGIFVREDSIEVNSTAAPGEDATSPSFSGDEAQILPQRQSKFSTTASSYVAAAAAAAAAAGGGDGKSSMIDRESSINSITSKETSTTAAGTDISDKKNKVTGLLKLKLSQMMELLNHQLEIVVELEEEDKRAVSNTKKVSELYSEILSITNQEQNLIDAFKLHLNDRVGTSSDPTTSN